jgi:hypothetical protein
MVLVIVFVTDAVRVLLSVCVSVCSDEKVCVVDIVAVAEGLGVGGGVTVSVCVAVCVSSAVSVSVIVRPSLEKDGVRVFVSVMFSVQVKV